MIGEVEDIRMPYEFDVSGGAYSVLGAVGEAVATEAGLENHYEGVGTYDTAKGFIFPVTGPMKEKFDAKAVGIKETCKEQGIHAKFDSDLIIGYRHCAFDLVKTEDLGHENTGPYWTRITEKYTIDAEYGSLRDKLTENIDKIEDLSGVKAAVDNAGAAAVAYELIDSFDGYVDRHSNTAEVFGLDSGELYGEMRGKLDANVSSRQEKIDNDFLGKVPLFGKWYKGRQEAKLEDMRLHKEQQINVMEAIFGPRDE